MSISSGDVHLQHKEPFQFVERDMTSVFFWAINPIPFFIKFPKHVSQKFHQAPAGAHRQYKGLRHKLLPFPLSSPGCSPATSQAPDGTGRDITPCPPTPPHARGHSTKSHAVPQSSHCISPWPLCFDQCIHYSLGKVCKDPAQHPEAQLT